MTNKMNSCQMVTCSIALALLSGLLACDRDSSHEDHSPANATHDDVNGGHDNDGNKHGGEVVVLTDTQLRSHGVEFAPLAAGSIVTYLTLPAEVGFNQDALLHITPRVPGIATDVFTFLGDHVKIGQTLAVLVSPELGEAKITLLQALQALAIAEADFARQTTISANTERLLDLLRGEPTLEALRTQSAALRIGENKGRLLSAYARQNASEANHTRELELRAKGLSTQADLLAAQESYSSAIAEYMAVFEEIDFTYRVLLQESQRAARTTAFTVQNSKRRLHLFGLTDEQIEAVSTESPADIARFEIKSPGAGRIVSKHLTPGEKVGDDDPVYTVASLETVWLNIAVYERYLDQIHEGQRVVVHAEGRDAAGLVTYVSAALSKATRTVTARVVLENEDRSWRPGEFMTVRIETGRESVRRRVPIEAIQDWEGRSVVFVRNDEGIEPRPVQLGLRSDQYVEIVGDDLPLGAMVVVKNSFLMKAELGKSSAGHDH